MTEKELQFANLLFILLIGGNYDENSGKYFTEIYREELKAFFQDVSYNLYILKEIFGNVSYTDIMKVIGYTCSYFIPYENMNIERLSTLTKDYCELILENA